MRLRSSSCALILLLGSLLSSSGFCADEKAAETQRILDAIKPGEWYEVPNSRLDAVAAPKSQFPWLSGSSGIAGVISCWAGGAFDSQRDQLYIGPGGGHNGYNGNEVYAFNLYELKWRRLTDPYPIIHGETCDPKLAPFAMHTYDGVEYLPPPMDRYVVVGGWDTPDTYALNPDQPGKWEVYPGHGTGRTGDISAYDPIQQVLYFNSPITSGKLSQWNPISHTWTLRASNSMVGMDYNTTGDFDSKRGIFFAAGNHKVYAWPMGAIPSVVSGGQIKTTGDTEIIDVQCPGFCYAPLLDKFVAWKNGGDVYTFEPEAKVWTRVSPAGTNKVIPDKPDQWGTYGRFRYVASQNLFILYNSVKQNVYLYRLTGDKPNVITGVKATLTRNNVDAMIPAAAITVEALYADGSKKDVTTLADYFALDAALATVEQRGKGVVTGRSAGEAKIRVVYTDPAFKRGFDATVTVRVNDSLKNATLDGLRLKYSRLTLVTGDAFKLAAIGKYSLGTEKFEQDGDSRAEWKSDAPEVVSVANGELKPLKAGGPVRITATLNGKSESAEVTVADSPVIQRINFQVKDESPRDGWQAANGKTFSDARGFGWVKGGNFTTRDDRTNTKNVLLKSLVSTGSDARDFKAKLAPGWYTLRVAMGDPQYGAISFATWTEHNGEKLLYYTGKANDRVTRIVQVGDEGLVLKVLGAINYLIVAPVGVDLEKYANDGD